MTNKLLYEMTRHAYSTVSYYTSRENAPKDFDPAQFDKQFPTIPYLYKDQVLHNETQFISDAYRTDFYEGNLIKRHTSGSTGSCLNVYWSMSDDTFANLSVWKYRSEWYGVGPTDHFITFHTTQYRANRFVENPDEIYSDGLNLSLNKLNLSEDSVPRFLKKIEAFQPTWIQAQPSVIHLILSLMPPESAHALDTVRYIELTGEYLHAGIREYIQDRLPHVQIANMYGAIEVGTIALECPRGHQHVITNNAFVEIIDDQHKRVMNQEGHVVVTGLKNTTMPFIRYWLGDMAVLSDTACNCGCPLPVIKLTAGREGQDLILAGGQRLPCYVLLYPIERINDEFSSPIVQFQAAQKAPGRFVVHLFIRDECRNWFGAIQNAFLESIRKYIPEGAQWEFVLQDWHTAPVTNKLQFFVRDEQGG